MSYHERYLPHCYPADATLFLTWRLFGTLPQAKQRTGLTPGQAFARKDRLLDTAANGPQWLKDPRIAAVVSKAMEQGEREYQLHERHAWAIMPNHVHLVMRPVQPLPVCMRWLKGSTARSANLILGRTGRPFWQYESYDRCIRNAAELEKIIRYVERNPVKAGLARTIEEWPWSSTGQNAPV